MDKICLECQRNFETKFNSKTCGIKCARIRHRRQISDWVKQNPQKTRLANKKTKLKNKVNVDNYRSIRRNSKAGYLDRFLERAKVECPDTDLDRAFLESLINSEVCAITGIAFRYKNNYECSQNPLAPSLDRIDSLSGYYKDNVQIVLSCINSMKKDMPNKDFLHLWEALKNA